MAVLRIVTLVAVCVTALSKCALSRPASDDDTDFAIDDAPMAEPGPPAMLVPGSGEENPGAGSGEGDAEDDMVSSGEELLSGSASGASGIEVGIARTDNKSAPVFTTLRQNIPSSTTVRFETSSATVHSETSSATVNSEISSTTVHSEISSTTVYSVTSATTVPETSSTTVRSETFPTTDHQETSSATGLASAFSTTDRALPSIQGGSFINLEDESGSGVEDDPEPETTTEVPEDVVSGSGIDWLLEKSINRFTSDRPPDGLDTTDIPTLSPEVEIKEDLIPVKVPKTPEPARVNTTIVASLIPTTTPQSSPKEATLPTPTKSLYIDGKSGETTPESDSSTGLPATDADKPHSSTRAENHTRHIEGRRRRPVHHDTTPAISYEDVSVAEAKEEDDDDKKVSYFAVIAAALVSAIVFFALGYLASILKDKRRRLTLPWKKDRVTLERSIADPGNGSATQVYRDTNPDRVTSVYDPVNAGSGKPKQNGSTEKMPTNDLAEVHPKPPHLTEPDTVMNVSSTNEASPKISSPFNEVAPAPSSGDATDEMKYIDETDDDMEAPVASTPLLPDQSPEEAERGDLASQVLSTVDKNLNTEPDAAPLLTDSTKDNTSSGNRSPV